MDKDDNGKLRLERVNCKPLPKAETQQTRNINSMLGECWADVVDGGTTLTRHSFNVSSLLGRPRTLFAKGHDTPVKMEQSCYMDLLNKQGCFIWTGGFMPLLLFGSWNFVLIIFIVEHQSRMTFFYFLRKMNISCQLENYSLASRSHTS